ncbi:MAG: hypothetical protein ABFQ89_06865, partial [Chloroflexota bacterium]
MIERLIDRLQFRPAQLLIYLVAICAGLSLFHLQLPMAATVLLGLVLVTAIIIEPLVGLSVAIVIGPLGAIENAILHTGSVDSAQIVLVLTAGSWIAHRILRRQVEWPKGIVAISISYAAFLLVSIISLLIAVDLAAALKEIAKWLQIGLVAVMIALPGRDHSKDAVIKWMAAALVVSALVQSAVGIWQFGIRGDGPEHFSILGQYFRAYGTFEQPNPYAGFLGLVL